MTGQPAAGGGLRIAHVATLVTPTGAYGGPVRVATNLVVEVRRRGHAAVLWGGSAGFPARPTAVDGAPAALDRAIVPRGGFAATVAPGLLWRIWRQRHSVDLLHLHLARDLVTMPAALLARALRIPYVAQTHGMIVPKPGVVARLFDVLFTRPALRGAHTVFHLTELERQHLLAVSPGLPVRLLRNGVPVPNPGERVPRQGGPVEFLFLARLHPRKRPLVFVEAAQTLLAEGVDARFAVVGPDGGEEQSVRAAVAATRHGERIRVERAVPPERTAERLGRADVYVLPSVDEPYPMGVLEAMSLGLPVVITTSCGLADAVADAGAGLVVDESAGELTAALRRLASEPALRHRLGAAAARLTREDFGMEGVGTELCLTYGAVARRG